MLFSRVYIESHLSRSLRSSRVPYTLPSSVSRKSCSCQSYENCRGVYQQFPFRASPTTLLAVFNVRAFKPANLQSFSTCFNLSPFLTHPCALFAQNTEVGRGIMLTSRKKGIPSLDRGEEAAVGGDVAVGHARRIEREAGIALAVEEDEAPGGMRALREEMDSFAGGERSAGASARNVGRRVHAECGAAKKIDGGLGQDDFHDGFAVARARNPAGFRVGIAAAADQRRIADAPGKLAAGAARGSGGEEASVGVDGN